MKKNNKTLPRGWTERKIRRVLDYYEHQTEDEEAAEIESAARSNTLMEIPRSLVPAVRSLIARHQRTSVGRRHSHTK